MTDTSLGERVAYTLAGAMIGLLASVIVTLLAGLFVAFYGAVLVNKPTSSDWARRNPRHRYCRAHRVSGFRGDYWMEDVSMTFHAEKAIHADGIYLTHSPSKVAHLIRGEWVYDYHPRNVEVNYPPTAVFSATVRQLDLGAAYLRRAEPGIGPTEADNLLATLIEGVEREESLKFAERIADTKCGVE